MYSTQVSALALNTLAPVYVEANAVAVRVVNRSSFDLAVLFSPNQPKITPATVLGTGVDVVPVGHTCVIQVPASSLGSAFNGQLWLYPLSSISGLASSGTGSLATAAYITSFLPSDEPTLSAATSTRVDASSQQRVVTIPSVASKLFIGSHNWAAFETFYPGDGNGSGSGDSQLDFGAALKGTWAICYLYRANFQVLAAPGAVITVNINVEEWSGVKGAGGALLASHPIYQVGWGNGFTAPFTPFLASPPRLDFFTNANTIALYLSMGNNGSVGIQLIYDVGIDIGSVSQNIFYPASIGGGFNGVTFGNIGQGGPY